MQGPHKVNDVRLSLKFFTAYHQYFHGDPQRVGGRQVCVDAEAPNDLCEDGGYVGNSTIATGNATEQRLPLGYDCSDCFNILQANVPLIDGIYSWSALFKVMFGRPIRDAHYIPNP